jgi:hypothetical protein
MVQLFPSLQSLQLFQEAAINLQGSIADLAAFAAARK